MISEYLSTLKGEADFTFEMDKKEILSIKSKGKEILVDIKNPMAAIDMGLLDLLKGKIKGSGSLKKLKNAGFKIKVKYKLFEFEL